MQQRRSFPVSTLNGLAANNADIVLITGPLTIRIKDQVLKVWNEIPEPKVTVAVGICPISGGVFKEGHSIQGPLDKYLPIDVNIPGCPPRPQAIMEGVLLAKEIWLKRIEEAKRKGVRRVQIS